MAHVNGNAGNGVAQPHTNGKSLHQKSASRKLSSPMMPAFMVSAPGKVIVFGEHAVVHGKVSTRVLRTAC
jgi:mevalonate kinase